MKRTLNSIIPCFFLVGIIACGGPNKAFISQSEIDSAPSPDPLPQPFPRETGDEDNSDIGRQSESLQRVFGCEDRPTAHRSCTARRADAARRRATARHANSPGVACPSAPTKLQENACRCRGSYGRRARSASDYSCYPCVGQRHGPPK